MTRMILLLAVVGLAALSQAKPSGEKEVEGGRAFPPNTVRKLSPLERKKHPNFHASHKHRAVGVIPDSFDARKKWPGCKSISTVRNQGMCGTCWAVSAASVISDRICITGNQQVQDFISSVQIASCYRPNQSGMDNCDAGGDAANAYKYATIYGAVSGGEFSSKQGCQPYPVSDRKMPITCSRSCTNSVFSKSVAQDAHFVESYWTTYVDNPSRSQIADNVRQMQTDIMTNGPITAAITVYSDFQTWSPDTFGGEPYRGPSYDAIEKGGHAIRLIGWGKSARGVPYWMISNSWGTDVGDKGIFWLEMGNNVIGIEDTISAPIVKLINTCGPMCNAPLDQIIKIKPADPRSPIIAFQGNCSVQVNIDTSGKMTPVGQVGPLAKIFVGAPPGPITKWMDDEEGQLWLLNPTGKAGACSPASGSTKMTCTAGTAQTGSGAQTTAGYDKYIYYNEPDKNQFMFLFPGGSSSGDGTFIDDRITSKFSAVNSLTDLGGSKMLICGTDVSGGGQCGVMTYGNYQWAPGSPGPLRNFLKC